MKSSSWSLGALLAALVCGHALAAPRVIDAARSEIAFKVTQMGVEVGGRFSRFEGTVDFDPARLDAATARIDVDIASLTTGDADADAVALDEPWLNQSGFPKASFVSSQIKSLGGDRYEATGTLKLRGKSRPLSVPLTISADKNGALKATGQLSLKRSDFGIGGGEWNEGDLVADAVPVNFRLHLIDKP
ncbi:MAG TPA: YceI family protein [Fontimonas sp.]